MHRYSDRGTHTVSLPGVLKVNPHLPFCSINVCCLRHTSPALRYLRIEQTKQPARTVRRHPKTCGFSRTHHVTAKSHQQQASPGQQSTVVSWAGWAISPHRICVGNHRPGNTSVEEGQIDMCSWLLHSIDTLDLSFLQALCFEPLSVP